MLLIHSFNQICFAFERYLDTNYEKIFKYIHHWCLSLIVLYSCVGSKRVPALCASCFWWDGVLGRRRCTFQGG